jgi:hypothetical protein
LNSENLVSLADRTTEEQREIARRGGIRSGEVRRERKAIRQALEECLSMETELGGETVTNVEAIAAAMVRKAREGDVRAFVEVRNSVGEMPAQRVEAAAQIAPEAYAEVERILFGGAADER